MVDILILWPKWKAENSFQSARLLSFFFAACSFWQFRWEENSYGAAGTKGSTMPDCLLYGITKAYRQHNRDTRPCNKVGPSLGSGYPYWFHWQTNVHLDVIINIIIIIIVRQREGKYLALCTFDLSDFFPFFSFYIFWIFVLFCCRTQGGNLRAQRSDGENGQRHQPNV